MITHPRRNPDGHDMHCRDRGFSLIEILVSLGMISLLLAMLMPAVQSARERSWNLTCVNNLKQHVTAMQQHETAHRAFPATSLTWFDNQTRHNAISAVRRMAAALDPTIGSQVSLDDPMTPTWHDFPQEFTPYPPHAELQLKQFSVFLCPSDRSSIGTNNYRTNMGLTAKIFPIDKDEKKFGAFTNSQAVRPGQFRDGLAYTVAFSERVRGDGDSQTYSPFEDYFGGADAPQETQALSVYCRTRSTPTPPMHFSFAGRTWLLGGWLNTWYSHVHSPNSEIPDCALGLGMNDGGESIIAARSFHSGHVNAATADGAVHAVNSMIDSQVWQHLGTRSGLEVLSDPF